MTQTQIIRRLLIFSKKYYKFYEKLYGSLDLKKTEYQRDLFFQLCDLALDIMRVPKSQINNNKGKPNIYHRGEYLGNIYYFIDNKVGLKDTIKELRDVAKRCRHYTKLCKSYKPYKIKE